MKILNISDIFYYDETSPSCLRWNISPSKLIQIGSVAGTINSSGDIERYRVMYKGSFYQVARVIFKIFNPSMDEELYVDHYDGNTLNNRIGNLRLTDVKGNGQNRKKNYNNLSGVTGVYFHTKSNSWRAAWKEDSKTIQKSFSCNKYLNAFEMACAYRKNMLELLNNNGCNYTERHGKEYEVL